MEAPYVKLAIRRVSSQVVRLAFSSWRGHVDESLTDVAVVVQSRKGCRLGGRRISSNVETVHFFMIVSIRHEFRDIEIAF